MAIAAIAMCIASCKGKQNTDHSEEAVEDSFPPCCPPTDFVVSLVRLDGFSKAEAETVKRDLEKHLPYICFA